MSARAFTTLCAALALGGCSAFGLGEKPNVRSICPQGLILADAGEMTLFREGPGRDLTDVVARVRVADVIVSCKPERYQVIVDLQVAIAADRGPANWIGKQDVDYFVAVVDPEGRIMARQDFRMSFVWPENRTRVGAVDELEPRIKVSSPDLAPQYQIWVGLQLTEEQLAWNRRPKP